jgi:uncharacterized coiled-coil DUF342 family protein
MKGTIHTCIFFPADFKLGGNNSNTIEFYVDESNINVVSLVKEAVSKQVTSRMQELSEDLTQDILSKIDEVKASATEQTAAIVSLIDESNKVSADVDDVQTNIDGLDLNFNKNDFQMASLDSRILSVKTNLGTLNTNVIAAMNKAMSHQSLPR